MRTSKLPYLLVALVLVTTLACSFSSLLSNTPSTSNFYMATDNTGNTHVTSYNSGQDFFVFFDVSNIPTGTPFQAKWYALDVTGQDPATAFQTTDYTYESGVSTIYFQLTNSGGWPTGHYRVDIYMNNNKIGEQTFTVQ